MKLVKRVICIKIDNLVNEIAAQIGTSAPAEKKMSPGCKMTRGVEMWFHGQTVSSEL